MGPLILLAASILLQVLAAGTSLWMIRVTGRRLGWLLLAAGLALMAVRRVLVLGDWVLHGVPGMPAVAAEGLGLLDAALLAAGVLMLAPVFRRMRDLAQDVEESREAYRDLFERAQIGIYRTTPDGRILAANPALVHMLGYESLQALQARDLEVTGFGPEYSRVEFKRRIETDGEIRGLEATWIRRDGAEIRVRENAAAVRDGNGVIQAYAGTVEDVTDRTRMEDQALRTEKLEALGVLAGGIAHDFNNLLTAVLGNVNLARLDVADGSAPHERLVDAEKALERAQALTRQLLTFAKGGAPLTRAVLLADVVRESAGFTLSGSRSRWTAAMPPDLWPVEADPGQVGQVVQNLVLNADQAMPGGGMVRLQGRNVEVGANDPVGLAPGRYVRLDVEDEGVGIPEGRLARIFDPYFSTKPRGSGLGLAVCHSIVRRHGGAIRVESRPGRGTRFEVFLPASSGEGGAAPAGSEAEIDPRGTGRILVLDDEDAVREVVVRVLKGLGYEAAGVADGVDAVAAWVDAMAAGRPFDGAIVDLTVAGGMGGAEAARALRAVDPGARLLVASGYSEDPVLADPARHGFDGYVAKPFRAAELGRALARVLRAGTVAPAAPGAVPEAPPPPARNP